MLEKGLFYYHIGSAKATLKAALYLTTARFLKISCILNIGVGNTYSDLLLYELIKLLYNHSCFLRWRCSFLFSYFLKF